MVGTIQVPFKDFRYDNNCSRTKWVFYTYLGTILCEVKDGYERSEHWLLFQRYLRVKSCGNFFQRSLRIESTWLIPLCKPPPGAQFAPIRSGISLTASSPRLDDSSNRG